MGHQSYVLLCTETTLSLSPRGISQIKLRRPSIKKFLPNTTQYGIKGRFLLLFIGKIPLKLLDHETRPGSKLSSPIKVC